MQFSLAFLSTALLATSALAAPSRLEQRVYQRLTKPLQRIEPSKTEVVGFDNTTEVDYSSNWAGAVLTAPPSGQTFTSVTGTFTVPTPKVPSGGSSSTAYSASAWVGIDGDTYQNAILQTGIDFTIQNGRVSYDAWYEWYPDYAYDFSGISISAGDSITVTVTSSSATAGVAKITNNSKGQTVSKSLTSSSRLGGQNAEWIVEDFESGGGMVPFANFGTVTFTGASYKASGGTTGGPSGADILDIKQGSKVLTSVSDSSSSVTITYTG